MEEGQSFQDFVMLCARAMVACVMMRDEPLDAPIPKFEPSDWHAKRIAEAKAEVAKLEAMDNAARIEFGESKKAADIKRNREWLAKEEAQNARLDEMRGKVSAWEPPTSDHEGLKRFMLEQIDISANSLNYIRESIAKAEAKAPVDYYAEAVAEAARSVTYHAEEDAKENARTDSRNEWVEKLRESLAEPAPSLG